MTDDGTPVLNLADAGGARESWGRSAFVVYLWGIAEVLFVTNSLQISSRIRVGVLRAFGAKIGEGVLFRPRTRVRFPWKLTIGDRSWIGEGVWLHNQDQLTIGSDVVISQDTFVTTGSHDLRGDMSLITKPVVIEDGAWITARCVVTGGAHIGRSSVIAPLTVISGEIPPNMIVRSGSELTMTPRFEKPEN